MEKELIKTLGGEVMEERKVYVEIEAVFSVKDLETDEWVTVESIERVVYYDEIGDEDPDYYVDLVEAEIETDFVKKYLPDDYEIVDMDADGGVWGSDFRRQTYLTHYNTLKEPCEVEVDGRKIKFEEFKVTFYHNYF